MAGAKRIAVVLGGGGMKGLAHIGVLKTLRRYGIQPTEYIGTSVGAFIAAMAAGGMSVEEMEAVALSIRKKDVLDYCWFNLLFRRADARSLCRGKQFHDFVRRSLAVDTFADLKYPLYITSVDINNGAEIIWGLPGLTDVPVHDCVMAACSVPGIFPPKRINDYYFVDGSLANSLPVHIAYYHQADLIVAVHLDSPATFRERAVQEEGILGILSQAQSINSQTLLANALDQFPGAPMVLIEPPVLTYGMFEFDRSAEVLQAGADAAEQALSRHPLIKKLTAPAAGEARSPSP